MLFAEAVMMAQEITVGVGASKELRSVYKNAKLCGWTVKLHVSALSTPVFRFFFFVGREPREGNEDGLARGLFVD
jgi:hypothetical protein